MGKKRPILQDSVGLRNTQHVPAPVIKGPEVASDGGTIERPALLRAYGLYCTAMPFFGRCQISVSPSESESSSGTAPLIRPSWCCLPRRPLSQCVGVEECES